MEEHDCPCRFTFIAFTTTAAACAGSDTAGNQLPYIDNLTMSYFAQSEVAILSMMQGSVDLGGRLPDPADFALYKENESIGDYTLREWQDLKTARMIYMFNLNHEDPAKRQVFLDKRTPCRWPSTVRRSTSSRSTGWQRRSSSPLPRDESIGDYTLREWQDLKTAARG